MTPPTGISPIDEIPVNQELTNLFRFINMRWLGDCVLAARRRHVLKIQRKSNGEVVLTLSGRLQADNVGELSAVLEGEASGRRVVLDLKDVVLVDRETVRFLRARERDGIALRNCPPYIREWIARDGLERG